MANVIVFCPDEVIAGEYVKLLKESGHSVKATAVSTSADAVQYVQEKSPNLVVIDHGGLSMGILRDIRKENRNITCVVVVEEEGTLFLNNLSTPRVQYVSGKSRFSKLAVAVQYGLAGKSTKDRIDETRG